MVIDNASGLFMKLRKKSYKPVYKKLKIIVFSANPAKHYEGNRFLFRGLEVADIAQNT